MQASLISVVLALATPAAAQSDQRYIVVFHDGVDVDAATADLVGAHGGSADVVLRGGVNGFAGALGAGPAKAMSRDPRVKYVEVDGVASASSQQAHGKGKPSAPAPTPQPAQEDPTGIKRINATLKTGTFDFSVAVIDTGVQLDHPDLHVSPDGASFIFRKTPTDDNGHGTHVGGTIGAVDNEIGVVGVAPGITIVPVKVLDRQGSGSYSGVISGINWVRDNRASRKIKVANMSLGGPESQALEDAVQSAITAGVTFVVAAGNETDLASNYSPSGVADAITVAALFDQDGLPGAQGTDSRDDTLASFSNYGLAVDLIAPGVWIYSTWKNSEYNTISGTSMASPHVAGAAALVLRGSPGLSPAGVRTALVNAAKPSASGELNETPNAVLDVTGF